MSTSNWQNISYNIEIVRNLNPKSILDIGTGFGRWGILFREFLETWEHNKYKGDWERIIDGVEIFPGYIQSYHKFFYNNIFIEDALQFMRNVKNKYELINCGDVIEHFTKNDAEELIKLCLSKGKWILINIPIGKNWEQGPAPENLYEEHKSFWSIKDFKKYKYRIIKVFNDNTFREFAVILISNEKIEFDKRNGKYFLLKNLIRNKLGLNKLVKKIEQRKR
ncbi:MAG: class I SAM-dependent methyltransferase [Ignavibacteriae bacterium]|nr:MAG: class I SAM-dependent methyltransferase [Ignavibacteriota bacterium]